MRCKTAQLQMALAVGEDLPPSEAVTLQTHLADCSACRQVWDNQQRSFQAVQRALLRWRTQQMLELVAAKP